MRLTLAILMALAMLCVPAPAQDHRHPPQDADAHDAFYWHLTRPDIENAQPGSCCSGRDCYPTPARYRNGQWEALRREDRSWIAIGEGGMFAGKFGYNSTGRNDTLHVNQGQTSFALYGGATAATNANYTQAIIRGTVIYYRA